MWAVSHRSRVEGKARFMARVGRKRVKAYQEPVVWATVQALPHMGEDSCYLNPVTHKVV